MNSPYAASNRNGNIRFSVSEKVNEAWYQVSASAGMEITGLCGNAIMGSMEQKSHYTLKATPEALLVWLRVGATVPIRLYTACQPYSESASTSLP